MDNNNMPGASTLSHLGEIFGSLAAVLPNLRQCWSSKLDSVLFILYLLYPLSKLTSYLLWGDFDMETLAISLLALMRSTPVAPTITSRSLNQLKADIKHKNVPQPAIAPIFDVTRLALGSSDFLDAGLSTLSHMIKRLQQQDQLPILETQARRTIPQVLELFSHEKERLRTRAAQALSEFANISVDVADVVATSLRDHGVHSKDVRVFDAVCQCIIKMHHDNTLGPHSISLFSTCLIEKLHKDDPTIQTAIKTTLVQLLINAPEDTKISVKAKIRRRAPEAVKDEIFAQIESHVPEPDVELIPTATTFQYSKKTEERTHTASVSHNQVPNGHPISTSSSSMEHAQDSAAASLPFVHEPSAAELEAAKIEPHYVESARDLDHIFADILPHFEGKETEDNWRHREHDMLKIRRITKGNAPQEFLSQYTAGVKHMLDSLNKGCNSLRTTLATLSCHTVQDIARTLRPGLDPMVEMLFQCQLKLCASVKKLTSASGNACVSELLSCVTFTNRIGQHLLNATKDKNVQPRLYATKWIMIVLTRYGRQKPQLDQHLETLTAAITNGLNDRDKDVRVAMRPTFWAYARLWNDKSKSLISKLDKKQQELLLGDASNPFTKDWFSEAPAMTSGTVKGAKAPKASIKDTIAQQRALNKGPLERPGSAADIVSPAKEPPARMPPRPKSSLLTSRRQPLASSTGGMSSAPVRPLRPAPKTGPLRVVANETPAARRARTVEELSRPAKTPQSFAKAHPSTTVAPSASTNRSTAVAPKAVARSGATINPSVTTQSLTADVIAMECSEDNHSTATGTRSSQTNDTVSDEAPSTTTADTILTKDSNTAAPEARKRVSWSENDVPLIIDNRRPPSEVGLASIEKPPTGPVDTTSRVPVNGKATDSVGKAPILHGILSNKLPNRGMSRCLSDTPTTLSVEPSGFPVSEVSDLPVDETFSVPAPETTTESSDFGTATRLSQSPRTPASRKEAMKSACEDHNPLRVYEDDKESDSVDIWLEIANEKLTDCSLEIGNAVLGELPVNTEIRRRNSFSEKHNTTDNIGIYQTRQTISRAVAHIKDGTFDQHGHRKLRELIYKDNRWASGEDGRIVFDELILSIASVIQGSQIYTNMSLRKLHPLRLQTLNTLFALQVKNDHEVGRWAHRLLLALVHLRNDYPDDTRAFFQVDRITKGLLASRESYTSLMEMVRFIKSPSTQLEHQGFAYALDLVALILRRIDSPFSTTTELELGELVAKNICDIETDLRMAALQVALAMHERVKPESRFWDLLVELDTERKNLLTYYISSNER